MSNTHSSAGVYTSSKDASAFGKGVSTTIVGMVGAARFGTVNKKVPVRSSPEYTQVFGTRDPKYSMMGYCAELICDLASETHCVRLTNQAKYAAAYLSVDDLNAANPKIDLTNYTDESGEVIGIEDINDLGFLPTDEGIENIVGLFVTENPGEWSRNLSVSIVPNTPRGLDPIANKGLYNTKLFTINVYLGYAGEQTAPVESHTVCLEPYFDEFKKQYLIEDVLEKSAYIRFIRNEYFTADLRFVNSAFVYMQGGDDGLPVTDDQIAAGYIEHFSNPEEVPVNLLVETGYGSHIVQRAMQQAADNHINCHCIANVPSDQQSVNRSIQYRKNTLNLRCRNMSLYAPDILMFDKHTGRKIFVPCSGYVAAVYLHVDNTRGCWFTPAGIKASENLSILDMRHYYEEEDRDALTSAQVNYFRKLPSNLGIALWEQATLIDTPSAFQMTAVQRMQGYVLASSAKICRVGLFDPNDSILRDQVKDFVTTVCEGVARNRGLRKRNGSKGYVVVCDDRNNTNDSIANGDLIVDVILDATRTTKRIGVRFNLNPKGSRATEFIA